MAIAVVSVPVRDQQAALGFYVDVMGFRVMEDEAMGPGMRWLQLQPRDGGSSIALVTWFDALQPGGQQGLLLGVADIEAEHARLTRLGVAPSPIEAQPWGRFAMLRDPDGNGWILSELAAPEKFASR